MGGKGSIVAEATSLTRFGYLPAETWWSNAFFVHQIERRLEVENSGQTVMLQVGHFFMKCGGKKSEWPNTLSADKPAYSLTASRTAWALTCVYV
jgi:hypothetical protein